MHRLHKRTQHTVWSVIGACIFVYFLYHAIQGDRGWFAMLRMEHEVKSAQVTLEKLQKERQELKHRTQLMNNNSLDPDLLEEKSRELLNYSKPNEIVILTGPDSTPSAAINEQKKREPPQP